MTGHYRILVPRYPARTVTFERPWQARQIETDYDQRLKRAWHTFHVLCSSLHADGLVYDVTLNLNADEPHVLITASGKAISRKRHKPARTVRSSVTVAKCRQHLAAIEHYQKPPHQQGWRPPKIGNSYAYEYAKMTAEHVQAELEYWREMELLSGQCEHFKPGLSDENFYADDEVAA